MSWPTVPLGDLCEMDRQGLQSDEQDALSLPFVGVENVESGNGIINLNDSACVGSQKSTSFRFDERHVLYGKLRPYLNKVATPAFAGKCSTELVPLLPQAGVDREYLGYLLRRKETVDYAMSSVTGARMPRTDMKALMSLCVPLPSLDEQRRMVGILNRAAKIERLRKRAQGLLREFIPALFIEMFGDPADNSMGWKMEPLANLCNLAQYGTSKKANDQAEGMPLLRMGNVTYDGILDCAELKHVQISCADIAKYELHSGDIVFNRTNSKDLVGKTGLWDGRFPAVAASYFIRLRLDESRVTPTFVWAFMNSRYMKRRFFDIARGAIGQANINARELKSLMLPVPPIVTQRRFSALVSQADAMLASATTAEISATAISAALMSRLLGASS